MKNKKILSVLLAFVMALVSLPVMAIASEPSLGDIKVTQEVDIDALLEELVTYNKGCNNCYDTNFFIYRLMNHQLSGEPLYVTSKHIYSDQAESVVPFAWSIIVDTFYFVDGVSWRMRNLSPVFVEVSATGRLYNGNRLASIRHFTPGFMAPGDYHIMHLVSTIVSNGHTFWTRSTLSIWENGINRFLVTNR